MAYFLANSNEYKDIDYEDWLLLTPAEQENGKYYIHGAPESKQKIVTDSGTFTDASQNTYTGVTTDMISYDATNNQLLLKVGGADSVIPFSRGSSDEPVLLWTNPNPTSNFAAQTVALDLSKYKGVTIKWAGSTQSNTYLTWGSFNVGDVVTVPTSPTAPILGGGTYGTSSSGLAVYRALTITTAGIDFAGTGVAGTNHGAGYAIPREIYGLPCRIRPAQV